MLSVLEADGAVGKACGEALGSRRAIRRKVEAGEGRDVWFRHGVEVAFAVTVLGCRGVVRVSNVVDGMDEMDEVFAVTLMETDMVVFAAAEMVVGQGVASASSGRISAVNGLVVEDILVGLSVGFGDALVFVGGL